MLRDLVLGRLIIYVFTNDTALFKRPQIVGETNIENRVLFCWKSTLECLVIVTIRENLESTLLFVSFLFPSESHQFLFSYGSVSRHSLVGSDVSYWSRYLIDLKGFKRSYRLLYRTKGTFMTADLTLNTLVWTDQTFLIE